MSISQLMERSGLVLNSGKQAFYTGCEEHRHGGFSLMSNNRSHARASGCGLEKRSSTSAGRGGKNHPYHNRGDLGSGGHLVPEKVVAAGAWEVVPESCNGRSHRQCPLWLDVRAGSESQTAECSDKFDRLARR